MPTWKAEAQNPGLRQSTGGIPGCVGGIINGVGEDAKVGEVTSVKSRAMLGFDRADERHGRSCVCESGEVETKGLVGKSGGGG